MIWIWLLLAGYGIFMIGSGILMVAWGLFELVRQVIFGTGEP